MVSLAFGLSSPVALAMSAMPSAGDSKITPYQKQGTPHHLKNRKSVIAIGSLGKHSLELQLYLWWLILKLTEAAKYYLKKCYLKNTATEDDLNILSYFTKDVYVKDNLKETKANR